MENSRSNNFHASCFDKGFLCDYQEVWEGSGLSGKPWGFKLAPWAAKSTAIPKGVSALKGGQGLDRDPRVAESVGPQPITMMELAQIKHSSS
jgi:hypothetical protein